LINGRPLVPDPATVTGTGKEIMNTFRETRDEVRKRVQNLLTGIA